MISLSYLSHSIAIVALNRPEKRNALNEEMIEGLSETFSILNKSENIKIIILEAEGKAFCSGADLDQLRAMSQYNYEQNLADSIRLKDAFSLIWNSPHLIIAAVEGPAVAGGCGLVTVADYVIAADNAVFGYPETRIGFIPAIVSVFLKEKVGMGKGAPLLYSGKPFSPKEAQECGIVHSICIPGEARAEAHKLAKMWDESLSGASLKATKKLVRSLGSTDLNQRLEIACEANAQIRQGVDFQRGINAVLNKTKIDWSTLN